MPRSRSGRLLRALLATLLATVLTGLATACTVHETAERPARRMPVAPATQRAWLAEVDHIYATAGGRGRTAEQWLRQRAANRRPGERLAVAMGIDDVMLQTHFAGLRTPVARSVRFVRTAHALGYAVFYLTGRARSTGLADAEAALRRAHVPISAVYGRPSLGISEEDAKAASRASIERQGYTLVVAVAASAASFVGRPLPEREIHLPDFALRG